MAFHQRIGPERFESLYIIFNVKVSGLYRASIRQPNRYRYPALIIDIIVSVIQYRNLAGKNGGPFRRRIHPIIVYLISGILPSRRYVLFHQLESAFAFPGRLAQLAALFQGLLICPARIHRIFSIWHISVHRQQ